MKKLFFLLSFVVATICSAQQEKLEINGDGVLRVKESSREWALTGTTADAEAIKYINGFPRAISNPGTRILVGQGKKNLKLKPVFKKLVEVEKHFIIYKEDSDNIKLFFEVEKREEPSYLILFSIISILLMVISNILYKKNKKNFFVFFVAFLVAFAAASFSFASFAFAFAVLARVAAFAAFAFALLAFLVLFFAAVAGAAVIADKDYRVVVTIFYILMTVHIILLFV